jgi:outer membrane protein assembly factor BamB
MRHASSILLGSLLLMAGTGSLLAENYITGTCPSKILAAGTGRVIILSTNGETTWEYPAKLVHDVWMLKNGNVLFADGETVTEVTPAKKVVFKYAATNQQGGGTFSCQRLQNGNTLIGENSTGRVLEVDSKGKVVFTLQTTPAKPGDHHNLRMVRKLENGNYLVCHSGARIVKEYTPEGRVVWESAQPGPVAFAALRTPRGTTLVSSLDQIIEYDKDGAKIWECETKDFSDLHIMNMTGMHLLPNGNLVIGCYAAYKEGQGCALFEITRDKHVVWSYSNPKADGSMMGVQILTPKGARLYGPCLR